MDMENFLYELEIEMEVLLTFAYKETHKRYLSINGHEYSPQDVGSIIRKAIAKGETI